jgi:hypothetical protein
MRFSRYGLNDDRPWPPPLPPRFRLNVSGLGATRADAPTEDASTTVQRTEGVDLRYVPDPNSPAVGGPTIRSILESRSPPPEAGDEPLRGLGVRGGNHVVRNCTIDANMPVTVTNGSLILVASDVRSFGHVSWAEIARRPAAHGRLETSLLSMFDGPLVVSCSSHERPSKRADEYAATAAVAKTMNRRQGTHYEAEPAQAGEWADGRLRSRHTGESTVEVQVRQFSDDMARLVRGRSRGMRDYSVGALGRLLQSAIDEKTRVDADARRDAFLVLISPVPLGTIKRTEIAALQLDAGGYRDVWLYPVGEEAHSLIVG